MGIEGTLGQWRELADARYVSLETYRADGSAVATAVWIATDTSRVAASPADAERAAEAPTQPVLLVWTRADSYKVRRIRRNRQVRLAQCTLRGEVTGSWIDGVAVVLDPDQHDRVRNALVAKYGWQARISLWGSRLRGGTSRSIGIEIAPRDDAATNPG